MLGGSSGLSGVEGVSFVLPLGDGWLIVNRIELALGWWGGYDGYDLAALSLLSHGPPVSIYLCRNL
jgi:hypothetical protein